MLGNANMSMLKNLAVRVFMRIVIACKSCLSHIIALFIWCLNINLIWKFFFKLIEKCWASEPSLRPIPKAVLKELESIGPNNGESIEKVVSMVCIIISFITTFIMSCIHFIYFRSEHLKFNNLF